MSQVTSQSVFFFSSRRRHTRYIGDWSSDVCSSDLMAPDRTVTALLSPTGGAGRVEAAIRGAADTLRLTVAPLTAPAAVLVNPGYVTLMTLSPGNTAQLAAVVTDIAGKQLSPSLATWTSGTPDVAAVSSTR